MQNLDGDGYTYDEVKSALHSSNRHITFRYDLLDFDNINQGDITPLVRSCSVANNSLSDIKKSSRLVIEDSPDINWLSDRIRPWVWLEMPNGGYRKWAQGIFLPSTPTRGEDDSGMKVNRDVEAYDQLVILIDDKITDRYTIAAGANYIAEVQVILEGAGIVLHNLVATDKVLPVALDWDPGTTKLKIVNDLLNAINYRSLWFDQDGRAQAQPYLSPDDASAEYTYRDDDDSVTFPGVRETMELFEVPNVFVLVVSEPDRLPLRSEYTNSNPSSPTSTISRNRDIVDYREDQEAADQVSLDARVARIAFEASQVFGSVEFSTMIMPMHMDSDVLNLYYSNMGIAEKYSEVEWSFDFVAGAQMAHKIRRVVSI